MNKKSTINRYNELVVAKMRLDKFFTMFLDTYGSKMDSDNTETPIWKLYRAKLKEYDDISKETKAIEYWMKKREITLDEED